MNLWRALLAVALILTASPVRADDHARARAAFKVGSQHYNLGEFQAALEAFREAYRYVDDPSFLFNIAQCERQLGHKRDAVREYRAYLNNAPDSAENRDEIKQIIAQLEKEITDEQNTTKMPPTTVTPPPPVAGNDADVGGGERVAGDRAGADADGDRAGAERSAHPRTRSGGSGRSSVAWSSRARPPAWLSD